MTLAPWPEEEIRSFASIGTGAKDTKDRVTSGKYPFFVRSQKVERINSWSFDGEAVLTAGDGVGTGKVFHYIDGKFDYHQRVYRISDFRSDVSGRYFFHQFSRNFLARIESLTAKSSVDSVRMETIAGMRIPLPERAEQDRIVQAVDDAHDLIATLERLIAKKQAIKQGIMQQLLTGRTRLPGFTARWTDIALGDIARFSKGSGLPKSALTMSGSTPCIHYGELFTFYGPEIHTVVSRTNPTGRVVISEDLDVLMPTSDVTPRGLAKASAIHERGVVLGGDVLIIRPEPKCAYGPFLAHAIRRDADQVLQLVRGSTVYHLYAADMRNFTLTIPSVEEQRAIAEVLLDAELEIEGLHVRLSKARDIKTGMMQQLLTGRTRLSVEAES
ncbi:restriction endonuclease subunit S [Gordonia sihwensis]|uniref:restriction endonuclease subunit S n=1 Tax=Gordonia sihwensis TaxID=173559 RepID=UPI0005EF21C8|nr:restriction endonuclease subunit S [Gordonia sihwensis]